MSFIENRDEAFIARELFGEAADDIATSSFSACFDIFNKFVESNENYNLDSAALIDGAAALSPPQLVKLTKELKLEPSVTLQELRDRILLRSAAQHAPADHSNYRAAVNELIEASVNTLFMVNCSIYDIDRIPIGVSRNARWTNVDRFDDFLHRLIPRNKQHTIFQDLQLNAIKAWKIEKRGSVCFRPTSNLADHLLYDQRHGIVFLFQHSEFLKAQMQLANPIDTEADFSESIQRGLLPPRLVSETLATWYHILFRPGDDKSHKLLNDLIWNREHKFQDECENRYGAVVEIPHHAEFCYWGERLAVLHRLVKNPEPRSPLFRYLERKATERNALYIAILGLFIGALFGLLGFIVGVIQTVLAYRALQNQSSFHKMEG